MQRGTVGDEERRTGLRARVDVLEFEEGVAGVRRVEGIHTAVRVAVDRRARAVEEGTGGTAPVQVSEVAAGGAATEAADRVVGEDQAGAGAVAGGLDEIFGEVVEDGVVDLALEAVVDVNGVVALVVADQRGGAGTDEGRVVDHRGRVVGVVGDVAGHTVPFAAVVVGRGDAVSQQGGLDGEPELVGAGVALVDVKAVILVEREDDVAGVDRAAEELDAVVGVGEDLDVVDGGAGADTAEGEAVDLAS